MKDKKSFQDTLQNIKDSHKVVESWIKNIWSGVLAVLSEVYEDEKKRYDALSTLLGVLAIVLLMVSVNLLPALYVEIFVLAWIWAAYCPMVSGAILFAPVMMLAWWLSSVRKFEEELVNEYEKSRHKIFLAHILMLTVVPALLVLVKAYAAPYFLAAIIAMPIMFTCFLVYMTVPNLIPNITSAISGCAQVIAEGVYNICVSKESKISLLANLAKSVFERLRNWFAELFGLSKEEWQDFDMSAAKANGGNEVTLGGVKTVVGIESSGTQCESAARNNSQESDAINASEYGDGLYSAAGSTI